MGRLVLPAPLLGWFRRKRGFEVGQRGGDPLPEARETLAEDEMRSFGFFCRFLSFEFFWLAKRGRGVFRESFGLSVIIFEVQVLFFRSSLILAFGDFDGHQNCFDQANALCRFDGNNHRGTRASPSHWTS